MSMEFPLPQPPGMQEKTERHHLYVVVDCAQMADGFYDKITSDETILSKSLLMETPHTEAIEAGPLLIQLDTENNPDFIKTLQELEQKHPAIIWLWSKTDFDPLFRQMKKLLFGEGEDGIKMFLRFYDPRCLEGLLEVYRQDVQASHAIGHIQAWAFVKDDQYQYLK